MKPEKKAPDRLPIGRPGDEKQLKPSDSRAVPLSPQQIVARLRQILSQVKRLDLPAGELGCAFLDALELTDKIREQVRSRARDHLIEHPGTIPHWRTEEVPRRTLKVRNAGELYPELLPDYPTLTEAQLLEACASSITALEKVIGPVPAELFTVDLVRRLIREKEEGKP